MANRPIVLIASPWPRIETLPKTPGTPIAESLPIAEGPRHGSLGLLPSVVCAPKLKGFRGFPYREMHLLSSRVNRRTYSIATRGRCDVNTQRDPMLCMQVRWRDALLR